jgi:hypothetical protein
MGWNPKFMQPKNSHTLKYNFYRTWYFKFSICYFRSCTWLRSLHALQQMSLVISRFPPCESHQNLNQELLCEFSYIFMHKMGGGQWPWKELFNNITNIGVYQWNWNINLLQARGFKSVLYIILNFLKLGKINTSWKHATGIILQQVS